MIFSFMVILNFEEKIRPHLVTLLLGLLRAVGHVVLYVVLVVPVRIQNELQYW